jgi:hypothetical protein
LSSASAGLLNVSSFLPSFSRIIAFASVVSCLLVPVGFAARPGSTAKPFYRPVRPDFWKDVDKLIEAKKFAQIFVLEQPPAANGAEVEEWKLAMAKGMIAAGQPLHAQYWLSQLVASSVATRQGFEALHMLHEIAKAGPIDEILMEELAFDLDTKIEESETRSMIGYFKARALLRKGYVDWSAQSLKEVEPATTWNDELTYDRTLQILSSGDAATAYENFEKLAKGATARQPTVQQARLALARLIFERRDYKASIEMFREADLPVRERARSLSELAWSYYYDKEFGKALGVIKALHSVYFERLFTPETALLEMLIYRELCHYDRVRVLAASYQKQFSDVYRAIEDRLPLQNVARIMQTALQEGVLQKRANVIQAVRKERRDLLKQTWSAGQLRDDLVRLGQRRERISDLEVQRFLRDRVDAIANSFLDLREQVWYLDYEASLRLIQNAETVQPDYEPPSKSKTQPDNFFWPAGSSEAWLDELLNYEILVRGKCLVPERSKK